MNRLISLLLSLVCWMPSVWATSDDTLSITPAAVAGTTITAADENARSTAITNAFNPHSHVNDAELDRSARVFNSIANSIDSGTAEVLTFDSERWDTDAIHSTVSNTGRLTCVTAGKYFIAGHVEWAASTAQGLRRIEILLNGATVLALQDCEQRPLNAAQSVGCSITTHYNLAVNDYVELRVTQRATATLNVAVSGNYSPEFEMVKLP